MHIINVVSSYIIAAETQKDSGDQILEQLQAGIQQLEVDLEHAGAAPTKSTLSPENPTPTVPPAGISQGIDMQGCLTAPGIS